MTLFLYSRRSTNNESFFDYYDDERDWRGWSIQYRAGEWGTKSGTNSRLHLGTSKTLWGAMALLWDAIAREEAK